MGPEQLRCQWCFQLGQWVWEGWRVFRASGITHHSPGAHSPSRFLHLPLKATVQEQHVASGMFSPTDRLPFRNYHSRKFSSVQSLSFVWLSCDPMDCSTLGLPVHHQLLGFTQTHVHWVGDAIQSSHPLSSPSPAFNLSQHQGLFKWVSSSHEVAKGLEF